MLQTTAAVAREQGVAVEGLCRGLGFGLDDLDDPELRVSFRQASELLWRILDRAAPGLGLAVGLRNVLGTLGLLGHAVSLSRTLAAQKRVALGAARIWWAKTLDSHPSLAAVPRSGTAQ